MPQDTEPGTPTEGGRVYQKITVSQLESYAGTGSGAYRAADEVRKKVDDSLDDEAYQALSDVGISAVGFELEVSTEPPQLLPAFGDLEGPIGLSMVWLTNVAEGEPHGPHLYVFAVQGDGELESLSASPLEGLGCLFVMHYGGDDPKEIEDWEAAFAEVGVDAGEGGGLLSGEVTMDAGRAPIFSWNRHAKMWWGFVVDLFVAEDGTSVDVVDPHYEHYEWLLTQLGFLTTTEASWQGPQHSFWTSGDRAVPQWGGGGVGATLGTSGGTGGAGEVEFPSGETLPVVDGPDDRDDEHWPLSQKYWDPNYSGNPLLDTSGAHRDKQLSEHFTVGDYAASGGTEFTRARIDPGFVRYLEKLRESVNEELASDDDELDLVIGSGYRSWEYNREEITYAWPKDESTIESVEWGPHEEEVDGETEEYDWKLTLSDRPDPVYKDLTRSEHCSGRGADIEFRSSTYYQVESTAAYLRDPDADPAYDYFTDDILDVPSYSGWYGSTVPDSVERNDDTNVWQIARWTPVEKTGDSATNPDGDAVVKVKVKDGDVLGWTNEANLRWERNPGFDQVELGKVALETLVDDDGNDIGLEGVHACDPRTGIGGRYNDFHVDVKTRPWIGKSGPGWAYGDAPDGAKSDMRSKRNDVDENLDCPSGWGDPAVEEEDGIYGVHDPLSYLRKPDPENPEDDLKVADDENDPLREFWENSQDVYYNSDRSSWQLMRGIFVKYKDARTGPEGNKIAKVATPNDQLIGWTSFGNLVYTG